MLLFFFFQFVYWVSMARGAGKGKREGERGGEAVYREGGNGAGSGFQGVEIWEIPGQVSGVSGD